MQNMSILTGDNPKDYIRYIYSNFKDIPIEDLELTTIVGKDTWDKRHEIMAAILTIIKNPTTILGDPILFSRIALPLNGIEPDFMEYEFLTPEMINVVFKTIEEIGKYYPNLKVGPISDDVTRFIAVCCAEDGMFFLKNEIEFCQPHLLEVLETVFDSPIPTKDLETCNQLWEKYKMHTNLDNIPENTTEEIQVKKNIFIREYLKNLFI